MEADQLHWAKLPDSWQSLTAYPVQVELAIMDAQDKYVWRLAYSSMRIVLIDFPSDDPLFNSGAGVFPIQY